MPHMNLEKILRGVVLGGVFLLPFIVLYVSQSLFFPFITGKNFAFRIIVEIITGAWIALAIANPAYRPRRSMLLYAFAAFVLIIGVADIFGVYPLKSFWSNFERMEGWVTLAHLLAYFVVASSILNTERLWKQWWHTSLGVSVIVSVYALFQLLGFITINQGGVRLDATFGNATYLGVYMLFHIMIAALFLARAWVEEPKRRNIYALSYGALIAANAFILFFTSTRGAILGLVGGASLAALLMIFQNPRSGMARAATAIIATFMILAGGIWLARDSAFVRQVEPLRRLATLADGTVFSRFMNWNMALHGAKERPVLGWGQENYASVFDKYYDPNMWGQEPWFDRVHNILLDWLIAGGILGLLAYLSLYAFALITLWRSSAFQPYERAILTGLIAGYFFYLIFTFDNITSYLMFISLLAFVTARAHVIQPSIERRTMSENVHIGATCVVALGVVGMLWFVNAGALAQNHAIIAGITSQPEGALKNLEHLKVASGYRNAGLQEAREQLVQAAISVVGSPAFSNDIKLAFLNTAVEEMTKQAQLAPLSARFPYFTGMLFDHSGLYEDAKRALLKAHELSPQKQAFLFELGLNAFARGQNDEALGYFKQAYDLAPEYPEAATQYVAALVRAGKDLEGETLLRKLLESDKAANPRIAAAYASRGQYNKIIAIWTAHLAKMPDDIDARFLLVRAYYSAGNTDAAIRELVSIKQLAPSAAAQADELIKQVHAGTFPK
jgi:O-antigen ligase/Flp pilus assembly protein TadD